MLTMAVMALVKLTMLLLVVLLATDGAGEVDDAADGCPACHP